MLNLTELNGLLAINKLVGLTSAAVIRYLKLALTQKATPDLEGFIAAENTYIGHAKRKLWVPRLKLKVGHGGTLDPFASGVLVVGLGDGCKMLSRCLKGDKGYTATGCLGYATDTLDIDGIITDAQPSSASKVTESQLLDALSKFVGEISQMPPLYSSLKMDGKPLHHYVRNKLEFPRPVEPRLVNVKSLELLSFQPGHGRDFSTAGIGQGRNGPKVGDSARCLFEAAGTATRDHELTTFKLGVVCGGGTYVRSLISDIAEEVGTRGFVSGLVRTRQGPFELGKHTIEMGELSDPDRIVEVMKAASQLAIESNLP